MEKKGQQLNATNDINKLVEVSMLAHSYIDCLFKMLLEHFYSVILTSLADLMAAAAVSLNIFIVGLLF